MLKPTKRERSELNRSLATGDHLWRLNRQGRLQLVDGPVAPIDLRTAAFAVFESDSTVTILRDASTQHIDDGTAAGQDAAA